jgi:hypothetical protein
MNDITAQIYQSIGSAFVSMWYLLPLILIIAFFKSPYFKGKLGESIVNFSVTQRLDNDTYHLLKDITLPTSDGTTQIDHVLVSIYGIFIIETKNMKGWIFGSENQKKWTQKIFKYTNSFQNPLHQNYKHLKVLSSLLDVEDEKFHSLIVFTGESTFKTPMPENVLDRGYTKYIKSKNTVHLSESEVSSIIKRIESKQLEKSFKTNRNHVKHLKEKATTYAPRQNCPKCGSMLVKRMAKKGVNTGREFYGCSGFPRCRYTIANT